MEIALTVVATMGAVLGIGAILDRFRPANPPPMVAPQPPDGLRERVAELEIVVRGLPGLWQEERDRAERAAARVEAAAGRDKKRGAAGVPGPAVAGPVGPQVHAGNGGGGGQSGLWPVSGDMDSLAARAAEHEAREAMIRRALDGR